MTVNADRLLTHAEDLKNRAKYNEALPLFKKALRLCGRENDTSGMLECFLSIGDIYRMTGKFLLASENYSKAIELSRDIKDRIIFADAMVGCGLSLRGLGNWKEALSLFSKAKRIYAREGDGQGIAFVSWAEAGALRIKGDITGAIKSFKKSFELFGKIDQKPGEGYSLCGLGGTCRVAGLFQDSLRYYTSANWLFSGLKDIFGTAYSHCGIGNALRMMEDYEGALKQFRKAASLYRKIGDVVSYSYTLWSLGKTHTMLGSLDRAMDYFREAYGFFRKTGDPRGIIYCKLGIGEVRFMKGGIRRARMDFNSALTDAGRWKFAVEGCHARTLLSFIDGKTDYGCYNKLGLKLKFKKIPFNIP